MERAGRGHECGAGNVDKVPFRVRRKIRVQHVIYIIKENRTYDQLFGDLGAGDGDASLAMYGEDITPNEHALARQFGVLDNFYDSGDVSGDGHVWSTSASHHGLRGKNLAHRLPQPRTYVRLGRPVAWGHFSGG